MGAGELGADGSRGRGREALALAAVLGIAALLRSLAWQRSAALFDDGPLFIAIAEAMAEGDWTNALLHPYHPLYPLATRLLAPFCGGIEAGAAAVSILAGTAAVAALYAFVRDAFDRRTALVAALLLSLHAEALAVSSDVQSEGLYTALLLWAIFLLWRGLRAGRAGLAAWAGVLAGLAYLTRPEGLGVVVVGGVAVLALLVRRRWRPVQGIAFGLALMAGTALVAAPYVVALRVQTGEWRISQKKSALALATLSDPTLAPAAGRSAPANGRIGHPATLPRATDRTPANAFADRLVAAARDLYRSSIPAFGYEMWGLLALGLWASRRGRGTPPAVAGRGAFVAAIPLLYGLLLCALVWSAGYVSRRHALPPLIPLFGYAALGVEVVGRAALQMARRSAPRWAAPALGLALFAGLHLPDDLSARRSDRLAVRRAAEWLRDQPHTPGGVAAGRPRVAYYAGEPFIPLPSSPEGGMLRYLRGRGARYVIVDEAKIDQHLGLRQAASDGLRLLRRERARGRAAAVYQVDWPQAPPAAGAADAAKKS